MLIIVIEFTSIGETLLALDDGATFMPIEKLFVFHSNIMWWPVGTSTFSCNNKSGISTIVIVRSHCRTGLTAKNPHNDCVVCALALHTRGTYYIVPRTCSCCRCCCKASRSPKMASESTVIAWLLEFRSINAKMRNKNAEKLEVTCDESYVSQALDTGTTAERYTVLQCRRYIQLYISNCSTTVGVQSDSTEIWLTMN